MATLATAREGQSPTDRICARGIGRGHTAVIKSVFHVNINVTDFDRSLAFYKLLGFKVVLDLGEGPNHGNDVGLNIANSRARAALLSLGDDPRATRIDLIEWKQPRTAGESYPHLYHTGIGRIALFAKNLDEEYQRLKAAGVDLVSKPVVIRFGNKAGAKFFCFKDPDGTFLELIEPCNG
jgi:catechol 2,3-dioxygenase-like lactoylglutathione lyase family enzyme